VSDFQRRVPLAGYDEMEPWIDRIRRGETTALTRSPVTRLVPSSGSTAARKLIPYNRPLRAEFNRAIGAWIADLYRGRPALQDGPAYWSITPPADLPHEESAVPIGFDADSAYLGGLLQHVVDKTLAVPASVGRIADYEPFLRATLVHLLRARELRVISVWHPSFLTLLMRSLAQHWETLIDPTDPSERTDLRGTRPEDLRAIWPHLGLISCWGDAQASGALAELASRFPGVEIQPKGLFATEAFVTLPFSGFRPLAVTSHFFEFLDDAGRPHLAEDLRDGGEYSVVVTTGGGLYRYRLFDRVRVEGLFGRTPSLAFLGKEDQVSDLCGEKLNESHVARVLDEALVGLDAAFALLAPDEREEGLGYTLYLQSRFPPPPELAEKLEAGLSANPGYRHAVALGQLAPLRLFLVSGDAHHAYLERCRRAGASLGQIKPRALSRERGWSSLLSGRPLHALEPAAR
jgi:hypothetical protein